MTDEEKAQRLAELISLANEKTREYNEFVTELIQYQQMLTNNRLRNPHDLEQSPPRLKVKIDNLERTNSPERIKKEKELEQIRSEIDELRTALEGANKPDINSPSFLSSRRRLF